MTRFALSVVLLVAALVAQRKPNVLLMIADDQGWADLGCAGIKDDVQTPNLDALAARGVRFTRAYATSPICNASRAGLMTGCYQQRFGTYWYGGKGMHDPRFPTIAEVLEKHGYATGYVGKFHYGGNVHKPGNRSFPLEHGYGSFYGCSGGRKHYLIHEAAKEQQFQRAKRAHKRKGQSLQQGPMWVGRERRDQQGISTELFGQRARAFLREHKGKPFFLTVGFTAVHNFTHQLPRSYLEAKGLKGYHDWNPATEDYYDWYRRGRKPNNPEGRAHYLGQLFYLDREVGRILGCLDELGLRDDTIVIYIGDNGGSTPIYADNTPLRGSKYTLYEGGIRVPLIISAPKRFESGKLRDNVTSSMDLFPTICRAVGAPIPKHLDGQDLTRLLTGVDPSVGHTALFWDTRHETAVRHGRWKLKTAKSRRHADHEMVELELGTFLYDLEVDPSETRDLADARRDVLEKMVSLRQAWRRSLQGK